jgi:hypothetical protein
MHVIEPRHETFVDPAFVELAAKARVPIVYADSDDYPDIADLTGDFVYARLQRSHEDEAAGYAPGDLDQWARRAKLWGEGGAPDALRYVGGAAAGTSPREVFVYFIAGAKVRNPRAALALIDRLGPDNKASGGYEELDSEKKSAAGTRSAKPASSRAKTASKPAARTASSRAVKPAKPAAAKTSKAASGKTASSTAKTSARSTKPATAKAGKTAAASKAGGRAPSAKAASAKGAKAGAVTAKRTAAARKPAKTAKA